MSKLVKVIHYLAPGILSLGLVNTSSLQKSIDRQNPLKTFLMSAGYGALIGAGAGAASLAIVDNPGNQTGNITKGASLGLYAGIGIGTYLVLTRNSAAESASLWIEPLPNHPSKQAALGGAKILYQSTF